MACRLVSAKPLPEPMLEYCQFDTWENGEILSEIHAILFMKMPWEMSSPKWGRTSTAYNTLVFIRNISLTHLMNLLKIGFFLTVFFLNYAILMRYAFQFY